MRYSTFHALHIGATHVKLGLPCQDMCMSEGDECFSIAVVSDGHGNRRHFRSERGSRTACETASALIREFLVQTADLTHEEREAKIPELKHRICLDWRKAILSDAKNDPWTPEEIEEQKNLLSEEQFERFLRGETAPLAYGCTLCAVFRAEWGWGALQLGDGCVVVIDPDGTYRWPMPESLVNSGHRTASLCAGNPLTDFRHVMEYGRHPVGLMAYSDGIEKTLPSEGKELITMLHWIWKKQRAGDESSIEKLTKLLGEISRRSRIGDDASIAGIIDTEADDIAPKFSPDAQIRELQAMESQREELLATVEYNRRRLSDILKEAPGSDAEGQIRQILSRREADLTAMTATVNAMRTQLGLEPLAVPAEETETPGDISGEAGSARIPEGHEGEETEFPDAPDGGEDTEIPDEPGGEEPGAEAAADEAQGQPDRYFWAEESDHGAEETAQPEYRWTPDELEKEIRRRTAENPEAMGRSQTPEDLELLLHQLREQHARRNAPERREPHFPNIDPSRFPEDMRNIVQDLWDLMLNPFGKRR